MPFFSLRRITFFPDFWAFLSYRMLCGGWWCPFWGGRSYLFHPPWHRPVGFPLVISRKKSSLANVDTSDEWTQQCQKKHPLLLRHFNLHEQTGQTGFFSEPAFLGGKFQSFIQTEMLHVWIIYLHYVKQMATWTRGNGLRYIFPSHKTASESGKLYGFVMTWLWYWGS